MTHLQTTNPRLLELPTTLSDYNFASDLAGIPVSEFEAWIREGYNTVSDTLMILQDFDGLTDAQMVRAANLCDYEGVSITQAVREVLGC